MKTGSGPAIQWIFSLLFLLHSTAVIIAQDYDGPPTVQDCLGAIPVCQPVYSTTTSYTGHGNVYPEIRNNSLCPLCMDGEKNDVFYVITVQTSGILRFTLTPNNPSNDYDWSLFNMTNAGCDQIYTQASALQVSCNSYGVVGTNGPTGISTALGNNLNCNGPGTIGMKFNKDLNVVAGQTYVLNVSNWSSTNQSGYTLDFSGSTASIFDVTPPVIDSIALQVPCEGSDSIYFIFSENIRCNDVFHHPEKFALTGPAGSYTITDIHSTDCGTGASNGRRFQLMVSPKAMAGDYELSVTGDIRDLCDNLCLYQGYPFHMSGINAPLAAAGNDTSVANGAVITLHGSASGGFPPYSYHWEPAGYLVNPNVAQPQTTNLGASVEFSLQVTDSHGCPGDDDVLVTVVGGPLGVTAGASPSEVCSGVQSTLDAIVSGGSGNYTYTWSSTPPGFSSTLRNPVVFPQVTTIYHVQVADGFSVVSGNTTLGVHPEPVANAGANTSVAYGTNVQLNGSATGGTGNYSYLWTSVPPGYSSTQSSPLFTNFTQTTIFSLVVTDLATGCASNPDDVTVTVTGSPLACNPSASQPVICLGSQVTLRPMAGGGAGYYTYQWSSTPPGFSSTVAEPEVTPQITTIYHLTISDGFNNASGNTTVVVKEIPVFTGWHTDTVVCIYEKLTLDAGNPGSTYYWSNGATTQSVIAQSTGIGQDEQVYRVKVVNPQGCTDSATARIEFSFSACVGIGETNLPGLFSIFPNPSSGEVFLVMNCREPGAEITVFNLLGETVFAKSLGGSAPDADVNRLDLSFLLRGMYIAQARCGNHRVTGKFVRK